MRKDEKGRMANSEMQSDKSMNGVSAEGEEEETKYDMNSSYSQSFLRYMCIEETRDLGLTPCSVTTKKKSED